MSHNQLELKFTPTLFTIGLESTTPEGLKELLAANQVNVLVDIRRSPDTAHPASARREGIQEICRQLGIRYQWEIALIDTSRNPGRPDLTNEYSGMKTLNALLDRYDNVCLLCTESDPVECHRSYIARRMSETRTIEVVDLP